jgi:hypothetical protein
MTEFKHRREFLAIVLEAGRSGDGLHEEEPNNSRKVFVDYLVHYCMLHRKHQHEAGRIKDK